MNQVEQSCTVLEQVLFHLYPRSELNLPEHFSQFTHLGQVNNIILSNDVVGQFDDSESSLELYTSQLTLSSQEIEPENIDSDEDELVYLHHGSQSQPTAIALTDSNDEEQGEDEEDVTDENRCIVFGLRANLNFLNQTISSDGSASTNIRIFADGTFKTCPRLFYQVYTVHSIVKDKMFPIIYALLPNKQYNTYDHLLRVLKHELYSIGIDWAPAQFQIDYENGMMKAIRTVLPNCLIKGCYFHYCQAIIHKSGILGLSRFYHQPHHVVRQFIRYCLVLPLFPPDRLNQALAIIKTRVDSISSSQSYHDQSDAFIKYYEKTWFGINGRPARFPKEMWSQYNIFGNRTNSRLEAFHRNFNQTISPHANIWLFLQQVLTNLHSDLIAIEAFLHGGTSSTQTRDEQEDKNNRIAFFVEQLELGDSTLAQTLDHLSGVID